MLMAGVPEGESLGLLLAYWPVQKAWTQAFCIGIELCMWTLASWFCHTG